MKCTVCCFCNAKAYTDPTKKEKPEDFGWKSTGFIWWKNYYCFSCYSYIFYPEAF